MISCFHCKSNLLLDCIGEYYIGECNGCKAYYSISGSTISIIDQFYLISIINDKCSVIIRNTNFIFKVEKNELQSFIKKMNENLVFM